MAYISQTNEAADLGLVSSERSFSKNHFSSLILENSLKKFKLCSIKDGSYHDDGEEATGFVHYFQTNKARNVIKASEARI